MNVLKKAVAKKLRQKYLKEGISIGNFIAYKGECNIFIVLNYSVLFK